MSLTPDELAAQYVDPYRKRDRIEVSSERFEKGLSRGDEGGWGVGALVAHDGEALFVREGETWLLPGGRLESGEPPEVGAKREVKEETGVDIEITDLCSIAEQTFVCEGTDERYAFYFATFLGVPQDPRSHTRSPDRTIDEVSWRDRVPENTFDREHVVRLFDTYV